ncbi:hypothetical protein JTE90_029652 [Oedothorax gibbosus]|uniref:Uncharacterized protein n=1 Tax=Oedothorax gibbosus TaxID=931172 RepID=A0AAV6VGA4_9ARAC|nr:hypothetical protein JTE90_029652 [Oedothorax gibbosus]
MALYHELGLISPRVHSNALEVRSLGIVWHSPKAKASPGRKTRASPEQRISSSECKFRCRRDKNSLEMKCLVEERAN